MSKHIKSENKLITKETIFSTLKESFVKLNPAQMVRNPVMFFVEAGTAVMLVLTLILAFKPDSSQGSTGYNLFITVILF